jgi:cysteine synthase
MVLDRDRLDEVAAISNEWAFATGRAAARPQGLPIGISSGAMLTAVLEDPARPQMTGRRIVVIVASCALRFADL